MAFLTQCGDRADCGCLKIKDFSKMALVVDADEQRVTSLNKLCSPCQRPSLRVSSLIIAQDKQRQISAAYASASALPPKSSSMFPLFL